MLTAPAAPAVGVAAAVPAAPRAMPRRHARMPVAITTAGLAVCALTLLPLVFVGGSALATGWPTLSAMIFRPRVGELFVNTWLLIALAIPMAVLLGVALAWTTERCSLPARGWWRALAAAPLAVPAFVQGYAWVSLWPSFHGLPAAVVVSVLAYFPFVYLPVVATLRRLDPALEDVAASLAMKPLAAFVRVVLPQLRLAIMGGVMLMGLHLLAEYGLFAMLRFDTFTTAIFDQFQSTFSGPAASALAAVLVLCCLAFLGGDAALRGGARYARLGTGSARPYRPRPCTVLRRMLHVMLPLAIALLSLGVPCVTLARWLYAGGAAVWRATDLAQALGQTLALGMAGALITVAAAWPAAWLGVRRPGRLARLLEAANYVSGSLPGIVTALALVRVAITVAPAIYQTLVTLLAAYLLLFLPRALVALRATLAQAPPELEWAAQSLGRTPAQARRQVTLRLVVPGAAAGAALVFLGIVHELTATLLLAPNGTTTLATGFWAMTDEIDYASAAPYATLMIVLSLPMTLLLHRSAFGRAPAQ
jgi:iron(III) transport system permease protein